MAFHSDRLTEVPGIGEIREEFVGDEYMIQNAI
jgi:hypothetical protein